VPVKQWLKIVVVVIVVVAAAAAGDSAGAIHPVLQCMRCLSPPAQDAERLIPSLPNCQSKK